MSEKNEVTRSTEELSERDADRAKTSGGPRGAAVRGSLLGAGVLLVAALLVLVNYVGWKYHHRFDWTASNFYTLSEQTENVLHHLDEIDKDVDVVVFMAPGNDLYDRVHELLSRYEAASSHLSVQWLDPERNPAEVQKLVDQYGVKTRSVVFSAGNEKRTVTADELQELDYSSMQRGGQPQISAFKGEQLFTNALAALSSGKVPKVLFTTGHGELRLDRAADRSLSGLVDVLGEDNFKLQEWQSRTATAVPDDADLVVIAGPTNAFLPSEIDVLDRYLRSGGRLLVMIDPVFSPSGDGLVPTGLEPWLKGYGVDIADDLVLDPVNRVPAYGPETLFVSDYTSHPVTGSLGERQIPVILSVARSVKAGTAPAGAKTTELFRTSSDAWGETDFQGLQKAAPGDGDATGPLPLAVAVESKAAKSADDDTTKDGAADAADAKGGKDSAKGDAKASSDAQGSTGMRLVVIGDSDIASGLLVANPGLGNATLLNNAFNWLVERQSLLGIPPKRPEQVRLSMTPGALRWSVIFVTILMPGLAILAGLWVWSRRRRAS